MTPPAWVRKRDGTLVPFDPDRISRALFEAGENLGQLDAFLARELTDGVVHFLASEGCDRPLTTEQIEECIAKTVRELGHPALARAFADGTQRQDQLIGIDRSTRANYARQLTVPADPGVSRLELTAACMRAFSLQHVFSPDLVAAHRDGLLTLTGLESPFELSGCVLDPGPALLESVARARRQAGIFVAVDGPEYSLAERSADLPSYVSDLCITLQTVGLKGIVNLNSAVPPSWASGGADGPLFADSAAASKRRSVTAAAYDLLSALLGAKLSHPYIEILWHLSEADFDRPNSERLRHIVERALAGSAPAFAFDRPRRPVLLAGGLDRQNPTELLTVRLNLPALAVQVAGHHDAAARFLQKLGSAVRLILSAGVQKRDFLRNHGSDKHPLGSSFLVERARLMVAPVGLHSVVAGFFGCSLAESAEGLEFARRVVERLLFEVHEDGRTRHLAVGLDGSCLTASFDPGLETPPVCSIQEQLRTACALSAAGDLTTVTLEIPETAATDSGELLEALHWLWERSDVRGLQMLPKSRSPRQLMLGP
jgi:hypothetical protein